MLAALAKLRLLVLPAARGRRLVDARRHLVPTPSITWTITLTTVFIVAVTITLLATLSVRRERAVFVSNLEEKGLLFAQGIDALLADSIYSLDIARAQSTAEVFATDPDMTYIRVAGVDGPPFLSVGDDTVPGASDELREAALDGRQTVLQLGDRQLDVVTPILIGDEPLGIAYFGLDAKQLRAALRGIVMLHVWQGLLLMALAIPVSYVVAQNLARPIRSLAAATRRVGEGDFDTLVGSNRRDEIGRLAGDFDTMILRLRDAREAAAKSSASASENEALLKEVHHRVKNNLQIVSSLMSLQANASANEEAAMALQESESRIKSLALVHERLHRSDLSRIDLGDYLREIGENLIKSYGDTPDQIALEVNAPSCWLDADKAASCGLLATELISNSIKHAFPNGRLGTIGIDLSVDGEGVATLAVGDDGVGMPPGFSVENSSSLGMRLVPLFAQRLGATLAFTNDHGTACTVTFATESPSTGSKEAKL